MRFGARGRIRSVAVTLQPDANWQPITNGANAYANIKFGCQVTVTSTVARLTDLISVMGIKVWRNGGINWDGIEKSAGVYTLTDSNVTNADAYIAASLGSAEMIQGFARMSNTPVYPGTVFGNGNPGTCPTYSETVRQVAAHFGSNVNKYEIENEPNQLNDIGVFDVNALSNSYSFIKSANPAADVFGVAILDPNPAIANTLTDMFNAVASNGATWKDCSDGFSFHPYGGTPDQPTKTPEHNWWRGKNTIDTVYTYRSNCRIWITEYAGWPNGGGNAITQTLAGDYQSRYTFMMRCMRGVELASYYQDWDGDPNAQGLFTSGGAAKTQGTVYGDCLAVVHASIAGKYYQHASDNVLAVGLKMNDGTNRVALWAHTWKMSTGFANGSETTATAHVTFDAASTGLLSVKTMGGGAPTTQALSVGANVLSIPVTGRAVVLSASCLGTFRGLSGT